MIELSIETITLLVNCFASELVKKQTKNISKKIFLLIYFLELLYSANGRQYI